MVGISQLWLPVLLSSVFVFILSSLVHMVFGYHADDLRKLPDEDGFADALRKFNIPPGSYVLPRASSMKEMGTPEFKEKVKDSPSAIVTVRAGMNPSMAPFLAQWFVYSLVIGVFAAYVAGHAVGPEAPYLSVFRFVGATTFLCYAVGGWQESIWYSRSWSTTLKNTFDGLLYALVTAGTFGWLWPR
jgi:hypothetical protein